MRIIDWKGRGDASTETSKERLVRYAVGIPIFLIVYLVLALFYIYPHLPINLKGWAILIFAGFPIAICLEFIGEFTFIKETGQKILNKKFSVRRVLIALLVFAVITGVSIFMWFAYGSLIRQHFS